MNLKNILQSLKGLTPKQLEMVRDFNKELIKAVIEDIPNHDYVSGKYDPETDDTKVDMVWLKQQLRDKWLKGKDLA